MIGQQLNVCGFSTVGQTMLYSLKKEQFFFSFTDSSSRIICIAIVFVLCRFWSINFGSTVQLCYVYSHRCNFFYLFYSICLFFLFPFICRKKVICCVYIWFGINYESVFIFGWSILLRSQVFNWLTTILSHDIKEKISKMFFRQNSQLMKGC